MNTQDAETVVADILGYLFGARSEGERQERLGDARRILHCLEEEGFRVARIDGPSDG